MRRTGGRRSSRASSARSNAVLGHALTGTANYYASAASQGIRGAATGFWVMWLGVITTGVTNNYLTNCNAGTDGYRLYMTADNALRMLIVNGTPANTFSSIYDPTSVIGKIIHVVGVHTGAGDKNQLFVNGAQVGVDAACVGYTAPAGATLHRIGGVNAATTNVCMGVQGGLGVPSASQILANAQACRTARRIVAMAGVAPDHMWVPLPTVANIADSVGSDTMTQNGTPVATSSSTWSY